MRDERLVVAWGSWLIRCHGNRDATGDMGLSVLIEDVYTGGASKPTTPGSI